MLPELSVIPLGRGRSIRADIVDLVKIIDASRLGYRVTGLGPADGLSSKMPRRDAEED
jgi:uncharacterized protein YqgV (UPF0045/DUF77 family)